MTKLAQIILSCAVFASPALSGCSNTSVRHATSTPAAKGTSLDIAVREHQLQSVANRYSCDLNTHQDIFLYVQSFLRASNSYNFDITNDTAYRNAVVHNINVTGHYISPEYFEKYYLNPETSMIGDAYGPPRPAHVICIKKDLDGNYSVFIFSYSPKLMAYAAIDKIIVTSVGGKKYILPLVPPTKVESQESFVYANIGVPNVPTAMISVTNRVYAEQH